MLGGQSGSTGTSILFSRRISSTWAMRGGAGGSDSVWQITFVVEYPVTVEVENVHRRLALVFEPFEERIECGRVEEFAGHAAAGFSVDGIQYSLGVGARVEKAGVAGAADDKQQA